jgi:acid-sensing ion channel, other
MSSTDSKQCWPIARSTLADYSNIGSIHGVPYIGAKERTFGERILWSVMFLVMLVACNKLIFDVYLKWNQNPVIVSFANRPTSVWDIPFPAVTICPETKVEAYKLNITKMYHQFAGQKDFLYGRNETE